MKFLFHVVLALNGIFEFIFYLTNYLYHGYVEYTFNYLLTILQLYSSGICESSVWIIMQRVFIRIGKEYSY
jgi:hypothetical protein